MSLSRHSRGSHCVQKRLGRQRGSGHGGALLHRLPFARSRRHVLSLDNPPLNLTTLVTLDKLLFACRDIAADERVRAVVVTGSGSKAFCAGSDISEFPHVRDDVVSRKLARENEAFRALEQLPMPVIAALNGVALGGDSFCSWSRVFLELNDELHDASETWWAREACPRITIPMTYFVQPTQMLALRPKDNSRNCPACAAHTRWSRRATRSASGWPATSLRPSTISTGTTLRRSSNAPFRLSSYARGNVTRRATEKRCGPDGDTRTAS